MAASVQILLVTGSLRAASTNTAVLRTVAAVAPPGVTPVLYGGLADLPAFNPDDDVADLSSAVADLRAQIHAADALLFSTPEYAGALPGSLKNLLDWTVGDDQVGSIHEKPTGWVNTSPRGAAGAHHELRVVLGYAHATIVETACAHVPVTPAVIDGDGVIVDVALRNALGRIVAALADAVPSSNQAAPGPG